MLLKALMRTLITLIWHRTLNLFGLLKMQHVYEQLLLVLVVLSAILN